MATIGQRCVITLKGTFVPNGQEVQNVFAYECTAGSATTAELLQAFDLATKTLLEAITSVSVSYFQLDAINLDDDADFATRVIVWVGAVSGDVLPGFTAWEYQYERGVRSINNGRKAFCGVPESSQSNGVAVAGVVTDLGNLASYLEDPLVIAVPSATFTPRIWRREGIYGTPPLFQADTFYPIAGVSYKRISTQNTRKA